MSREFSGVCAETENTGRMRFFPAAEVPGDVTEYTHTGLTPGTTYYYAINPLNSERLESTTSSDIVWAVPGTEEYGKLAPVKWSPGKDIVKSPDAPSSGGDCFKRHRRLRLALIASGARPEKLQGRGP